MNARHFTRVPFKTEALVKSSKNVVSGEVENLSLNGMFLKTTEKLDIEDDVDIGISLMGTSSELSIKIKGTIVRHEDKGMAIQFSMKGLDVDSFVHLRNIIAYNRGEQDAVMEEYFSYLNKKS